VRSDAPSTDPTIRRWIKNYYLYYWDLF
jgi:hypothetical protein